MTQDYDFTVKGGVQIVEGKSRYPDMLTVRLGRRDVFEIVNSLIHYLEWGEGDDSHALYLLGKLNTESKDGASE